MASRGINDAAPIIIKKRRRGHAHGHHGGAWKIAYADFVTAMMAFFMLLWLIAQSDQPKLQGLAEYFSPKPSVTNSAAGAEGLFGGARVSETSEGKAEAAPAPASDAASEPERGATDAPDPAQRVFAEQLMVALTDVPKPQDVKTHVAMSPARSGLRIQLMDSAAQPMFRPGTADLYPFARDLLANVAHHLARGGQRIAIEGHTDASGTGDSNWTLSSLRAQSARRALLAAGLTPDRIAEVTALAANEPLYPDQPGRPENRRITLVVLSERGASPTDTTFRR